MKLTNVLRVGARLCVSVLTSSFNLTPSGGCADGRRSRHACTLEPRISWLRMTLILIADDHAVVRSGVRRIIEDHPGWTVVAEAADGKDAIAQAITTTPDVAILDYRLPLIDGIEATRQIRRRVPSVEVLIFTMHDDENLLRELLAAGARGSARKMMFTPCGSQLCRSHSPGRSASMAEIMFAPMLSQLTSVRMGVLPDCSAIHCLVPCAFEVWIHS